MSRQTLSFLLLSVAIVLAILAASTLLPLPSSKLSDLGYYALCSFAPWSTLALLFAAAVCWVMRQHILSKPE
jgi:hypothetical protein